MSQHASEQKISVNLLESNGRIYFFQPDIGVIASGDNVVSRELDPIVNAWRNPPLGP
jgi:hypothetical protein